MSVHLMTLWDSSLHLVFISSAVVHIFCCCSYLLLLFIPHQNTTQLSPEPGPAQHQFVTWLCLGLCTIISLDIAVKSCLSISYIICKVVVTYPDTSIRWRKGLSWHTRKHGMKAPDIAWCSCKERGKGVIMLDTMKTREEMCLLLLETIIRRKRRAGYCLTQWAVRLSVSVLTPFDQSCFVSL